MTESARTLRLLPDGRLDAPALMEEPRLRRLLALLDDGGEQARVVGGAVRNSLLGLPVSDVDIATTAEPAEVIRRAETARLRAIPTGLAHGTVTVVLEGTPFEVTTLRRDVDTDGRHAVVRFSRDFAEDAERRDFTINALSVDGQGVLYDTVGGLGDLAAGRVRFIGDPDRRIMEDYLRVLRFFRFHATYGEGQLDEAGFAATQRHRDALGRLSRERVRAELLKLLVAPRAVPVVDAMASAGIALPVLGQGCDPARLGRMVAVEAAQGTGPDALLRLAALAAHQPGDADLLRDGLRLSNDAWRRIAEAVAARGALDPARPPDRNGCLALLLTWGAQAAQDGVALAFADAEAGLDVAWTAALATVRSEPAPRLPVGGADLMARGLPGGRRVGAALKWLQAAWIRAGFPSDPAVLSRLIEEAVAASASLDLDGPAAPRPPASARPERA